MINFLPKDYRKNSPIAEWTKYLILGILAVLPLAIYLASQFITGSQIVALLFLLIIAAGSFISFESGLFALLIFLPLEPLLLKLIPDDLIIIFRLIPEAIITALFLRAVVSKKLKLDPIRYSLFLFIGLAIISVLVNQVEALNAVMGLRLLLRFIVLYEALVLFGLTSKQILKIVILVFVLAGFESVLGITQALVGNWLDNILSTGSEVFLGKFRIAQDIGQVREEGRRVFATMGRYDQLGTFLSLVSAMALGFAYHATGKLKKVSLFLLLLTIPTLVLTYSRASWFGFLLGLIAVAVVIKKDKKVVAALLLLLVTIFSYAALKEIEVRRLIDEPQLTPMQRLLEAFSEKRLRSEYRDKGRIFFIIETPKVLFPEHFLLGVGPGQYGGGAAASLHNTVAYDKLNLPFGVWTTEGQVDSNWMSVLGETGIFGLAAFASMFIMLLWFARKVVRDERSGWLAKSLALGLIAATASFVFQGILATNFEVRTLAPFFWVLAALTVLAYQNDVSTVGTNN